MNADAVPRFEAGHGADWREGAGLKRGIGRGRGEQRHCWRIQRSIEGISDTAKGYRSTCWFANVIWGITKDPGQQILVGDWQVASNWKEQIESDKYVKLDVTPT